MSAPGQRERERDRAGYVRIHRCVLLIIMCFRHTHTQIFSLDIYIYEHTYIHTYIDIDIDIDIPRGSKGLHG